MDKIKEKPKATNNLQNSLDELANLSGEASLKQTRYVVPILKFNGNTAKFSLLTPDENGKMVTEEVGSSVELVFLKVRRVYTAFEKTADSYIRYFTNEHSSWKEGLVLFERRKEANRPKVVAEGSYKELKEEFPNIRLTQYLYSLYNGGVVKLAIKGKSLGAFWQYVKDFKTDEHMFQFLTKIESHEETNEGGLTYHVMDFLNSGKPEADLEVVAPLIREVSTKLELQDKSFKEMPSTEKEETKDEKEEKEESLGEQPKEVGKEEEGIKVEDLPC